MTSEAVLSGIPGVLALYAAVRGLVSNTSRCGRSEHPTRLAGESVHPVVRALAMIRAVRDSVQESLSAARGLARCRQLPARAVLPVFRFRLCRDFISVTLPK